MFSSANKEIGEVLMSDFQLFVPHENGEFCPDLAQYVCVDATRNQVSLGLDQLSTQKHALNNGTASFIGIATNHCFLNLENVFSEEGASEIDGKVLFSKAKNVDLRMLNALGYTGEADSIFPDNVDILLPQATSWLNSEFMTPTYQHVMWYWWHRRNRDFDTLETIFETQCPEYLEDLQAYKNDDVGYPFGTFFMKNTLFKEYSEWMFSVLDSYLQTENLGEDISWVESLAPQIMTQHMLAIFIKHIKRSKKETTVAYAECKYFENMSNPYLEPAFETNNVSVVLASDSFYAPLMSVTIESIIQNSHESNNYDLIVLENGLKTADFKFLSQQIRGRKNFSLRFIHLQDSLENRGLPSLAHISTTTLARFLILEYLSAYSKVLYLDTDLVCNADVSEIYNIDVSDSLLAAVRDPASAGWSNIVDNGTQNHVNGVIGLENVNDYFNAGVLVMNIDALMKVTSCHELLEMSLDKKWLWLDQDILNSVCANKVKYLGQEWNYMAHKEAYFTPEVTPEVWLPLWLQNDYYAASKNPKIVHYVGRSTPCFSMYSDCAWYFWEYAKTSPYYEILVTIAQLEKDFDPFNTLAETHKYKQHMLARGPLVTLIIPVYNSARYLPELFDSLLRQTYRNLEILCINDGSSDNSLEVLQKYAETDKRIFVIDKENSGAGKTRNLGMKHIHGEYVCFVDSDDFVEEDAFEQLVQIAVKNKTDVVLFGIDQYDEQTGVFVPSPWAITRSQVPSRKVFSTIEIDNFYKYVTGFTVNKLYKTSYLLGLNLEFPSVGAHEDMPFTYLALSAADKAYYLDKTLYHYRRSREGSLSDETNMHYEYMFDALEHLKNGLIDRGLWEEWEQNFVNYALHMCIWKYSELSKFRALEFRDTCRKEWFERLDMTSHDLSYFFNPDEYDFLNSTVNMSLLRKVVAKCYRLKRNRSS